MILLLIDGPERGQAALAFLLFSFCTSLVSTEKPSVSLAVAVSQVCGRFEEFKMFRMYRARGNTFSDLHHSAVMEL